MPAASSSTIVPVIDHLAAVADSSVDDRPGLLGVLCRVADPRDRREYVQDRLAGVIRAPGGTAAGPVTRPWNGRNKPRRQDRRWATSWSPEQISRRLRVEFGDDESMRISHEAIYQALFIQGRGALKRELVACLRTGRALRVPRARARRRRDGMVTPEVMISERPAEADDRAVPGHWEGDLERHEASCDRAGVEGLRRCAVAAA